MIWAVDPLAVLGHEVRNLIATFVGFSELLLSQDWPPEKQREYLETMRSEGIRVSQFLNELLDLQRLESGGADLKARPIDLASLLRFAADVAAHDPRHPITRELPDELPPVIAEPDRIQQVLANLLSNARKYSPRGGPIRLSSRVVAGRIEVSVEDRGVGIPPQALQQVFEKFFRVESMAHRDIRGTGLGLAVCRQIVEAHGGKIWAESEGIGQGTRVTFSLPIAVVSPSQAPAAAALASRSEHLAPARQRDARDPQGLARPSIARAGARARVEVSGRRTWWRALPLAKRRRPCRL
jgi:signal transduction histidine kinase